MEFHQKKFMKLNYLISRVFLVWTFFNLLAHCGNTRLRDFIYSVLFRDLFKSSFLFHFKKDLAFVELGHLIKTLSNVTFSTKLNAATNLENEFKMVPRKILCLDIFVLYVGQLEMIVRAQYKTGLKNARVRNSLLMLMFQTI